MKSLSSQIEKSNLTSLVESILDDEDDILDRANEAGLESLMVQRLNEFDHDYIYNSRPQDFVKSVEIKGNKLTAYMDGGYRRCGFQLYDIDLRYEIILELIDEGYDVTLQAFQQGHTYAAGAVRCNSLDYYERSWNEAMSRMFKLISNPKFHMVDKSEINPGNMIIMIDTPIYSKAMDFTGLPKVLKIMYDVRDCPGYTVKGAKSKRLHIFGLPQRCDEAVLINCKADKLYIDSRNRANEITFQGTVDFSQSTFGEVYLDENNLYLAPYMIAGIIPEFDRFHTNLGDSLRGVFQSKNRRATGKETIEMMNRYFEDHPELINEFNKISRKFAIRTEGHTWELITKKTLISRKTVLSWKKTK